MTTPAPQTSGRGLFLGFLYAALAAALWSLITPFSRTLFSMGVSPLETSFWRTLFGGICFSAYALFRGGFAVSRRDGLWMFFLGGFLGLIMFAPFQVSIALSGGGTAVVLLYTAPAWVAVLSRFLFKEAISGVRLAAVGIALAGVILVSLSGGSSTRSFSALGIACGLLSGFGYASYFPYTYWFSRRCSIQALYAYAFLGGSLLMLPLAWPLMPDKPPEAWALLAFMSVLTNFCAYLALALSLRHISQVQSAVIGNIEPLLGTFWVWLFFGENFTPTGWAGCALIMLAVFLLTLEKSRR